MSLESDDAPPPERSADLSVLLDVLKYVSYEISGLVQNSDKILGLLGAATEELETEIRLAAPPPGGNTH